jgi:hypothetical protein
MHVQYVTNEKGKAIAVQITMKEWLELQKGIKKLELFDELKQAFTEMEQHGKGKLKTLTTKQLLSQL